MDRPRPPVFLREVLADPDLVRRLAEAHAPYAPVQRYFESEAEYGGVDQAPLSIIAPNFRGDWALGDVRVPGVESFLEHPGFRAAAAAMMDAEVVRPECVFANFTWQLPFPQGGGHTDVPAFTGFDRLKNPVWLLSAMGRSRLFEAERVDIVTAVAWFYRGSDGGLTYWPDGPEAAPRIHEGAIFNTALVGDNDFMFHHVNPVGRREDGLPRGLTLESRLAHAGGDTWSLVESGERIARFPWDAIRISVSWKARVFRTAEAAHAHDANEGGLTLDAVVGRFRDDLAARGVPCPEPRDPLRDPAFVETVVGTYAADGPAAV